MPMVEKHQLYLCFMFFQVCQWKHCAADPGLQKEIHHPWVWCVCKKNKQHLRGSAKQQRWKGSHGGAWLFLPTTLSLSLPWENFVVNWCCGHSGFRLQITSPNWPNLIQNYGACPCARSTARGKNSKLVVERVLTVLGSASADGAFPICEYLQDTQIIEAFLSEKDGIDLIYWCWGRLWNLMKVPEELLTLWRLWWLFPRSSLHVRNLVSHIDGISIIFIFYFLILFTS